MAEISPNIYIESIQSIVSKNPIIADSSKILDFTSYGNQLRERLPLTITIPVIKKSEIIGPDNIIRFHREELSEKPRGKKRVTKNSPSENLVEKPKRKRRPLVGDPFTTFTGEYKPYDGPFIRKEKGPRGITSHEKCFICQKILKVFVTPEEQQQMLINAEPGSIEFVSTDTWCDEHWELELQKRPELRKYEDQASA